MKKFVLSILLFTYGASAELCSPNLHTHVKAKCSARPFMFHPTQFNIGFLAMQAKREKVERYYKEGKLQRYLDKKIVPAYWGPDNKLYLIDRHHTTTGVWTANIPESKKVMKVEVLGDYSHLSFEEFYSVMNKSKLFYLFDNGVGPKDPSQISPSLKQLTDDPYRSLSWVVREEGGFEKVPVSYLEFMWADFFRKRIKLRSGSSRDINLVLKKALKFARSREASHLPGYKD